MKVVTYHKSWSYVSKWLGLVEVGYLEPKPGIPPSPSHTLELIKAMKEQNVKIILVEPYFDLKTPNSIARETGAKVLMLPPSVGGVPEVTDYIKLFDYDVRQIVEAYESAGGAGQPTPAK